MSKAAVDVPLKGGFSFDLCRRNDMLSKKGVQPPSFLKTGTTIVGLIFQVRVEFFLFDLILKFTVVDILVDGFELYYIR